MAKRHNSISNSSRVLSSKHRKKERRANISSRAYRGALLTTVREGTPSCILTTLKELENEGHIEPDENIIEEEFESDELSSLDSEISLEDEDLTHKEVFDIDINENHCVLGKTILDDRMSVFSSDCFEIIVNGSSCNLSFPMWPSMAPVTFLGQQILYEIDSRILVLKSIAHWLSKKRLNFLISRKCWDLGCNALDEIRLGLIPVEQKSFLEMLDLTTKVSEGSFSRFIRNCSIIWSDGICPINFLFSDTIKEVWAANAIVQFMAESKMELSSESLDYYSNVTIPRDSKNKRNLSSKSIESMDLPTFIGTVNMKARTKWKTIIEHYGNMMIGKNNENKRNKSV